MSILSVNRAEYESRLYDILQGLETGGISTGVISSERISATNLVKVKLDELIPEGEGVNYSLSTAPNKTNPIDIFINAHLDESAKYVSQIAPKHLIYPLALAESNGTPFSDGDKAGFIELPVNFLRIHSVKMKDWTLDVNENTPIESKMYKKQRHIAIRSKYTKPIISLNWRVISNVMKNVIEYYSINTSHDIDHVFYIPNTFTTDYTFENWFTDNPNLVDALAWTCAGKIMQITGQMDAFKYAMEQVKLSFQNL